MGTDSFDPDKLHSDSLNQYIDRIAKGDDLKKLSPEERKNLINELSLAQKDLIKETIFGTAKNEFAKIDLIDKFVESVKKEYLSKTDDKIKEVAKSVTSSNVSSDYEESPPSSYEESLFGSKGNLSVGYNEEPPFEFDTSPSDPTFGVPLPPPLAPLKPSSRPDDKRTAEDFKKEGATEASRLLLMQSALGIRFAPNDNPETKALYEEKRQFMAGMMKEPIEAHIIFNQNKNFPVMQAAMEKLASSYENWESMSQPDLSILQHQLFIQHRNLEKLAGILHIINDKESLAQISMDDSLNKHLAPFINGEKLIKATDELFLHSLILSHVENIRKEAVEPLGKEILEKRRQQSPISNTAIRMQADLFGTARSGASWAAKELFLSPLGNSANEVFKLDSFAYFKVGQGNEKAAGVMEKLMWDIALILGTEKQFAATKETEIRSGTDLVSGTNKAKYWEMESETNTMALKESTQATPGKKGGIQPALKGITLAEYGSDVSKSPSPVTKEQFNSAMLTTLVEGFFDTHLKNIIVDENGDLRFFDNTRSLPHSNGIIDWGGMLLPSFRSGILAFDAAYENLTTEERDNLKIKLESYQSKINALEAYLTSPSIKIALKKLPPGWFNVDEVLSSMKERIANLRAGLDDPKVANLRDLVFATYPDVKYFAALQVLVFGAENRYFLSDIDLSDWIQKQVLPAVGYYPVDSLIGKVAGLKIDPAIVKALCNNPNLSFEEIIRQLNDLYKKQLGTVETSDEAQTREENRARLTQEFYSKAKIDYKDINREQIPDKAMFRAYDEFKNAGTEILMTNYPDKWVTSAPPLSHVICFSNANPREMTLFYKTLEGTVKTNKIDYLTNPGKLFIDNRVYSSAREIKEAYVKDYFHLNVDAMIAEALLLSKPAGTWFLRSEPSNPNSLFISFVSDKNEIEHIQVKYDLKKKALIPDDSKSTVDVEKLMNLDFRLKAF